VKIEGILKSLRNVTTPDDLCATAVKFLLTAAGEEDWGCCQGETIAEFLWSKTKLSPWV